LILCTLFITCSLHAVGQEVQVPFDSAGRIMVITRELDAQLGLFLDQPGFSEARLFRLQDSSYALEVTAVSQGQFSRSRRAMSAIEGTSYLALVRERFRSRAPSASLDQSGRSALLWGSTLWSLIYYGTALNMVIYGDGSWPGGAAATPFLLAGASFALTAALTGNAPVSDGAASLALGGMFQGSIHGWLLASLISGDNAPTSLGFGLSILGGVVETVVGYTVATNTNMSEGKAGAINTTTFYSTVAGGLLASTILGESASSETYLRLIGGLGLVGAVGGVFLGDYLSTQQQYSSGDAGILATAAALGATLPLAAIVAVQPNHIDVRLISGLMLAGTALGVAAGDRLVVGKEFKGSHATVTTLATIGGALVGYGLGLAFQDPQVSVAGAWIGAAGGFTLGYTSYADDAESYHLHGDLRVQLNPASLALAASNLTPTMSVPFASMTYRW